jgi:hypothetical protein
MLLSIDGETFATDVTPAVMTDANDWQATQYGDWVILASGQADPLVLSPTGSQFIPFTNWPATYGTHKIQVIESFLVAVGIEVGGIEQSALVKWSDEVDITALQDVVWDPALNNLAGETVLPTSDGVIRDIVPLRDSGILYLVNSVWRMDLSGAAPQGVPEVFTFRQVFGNDDGILAERCSVEVEGNHYVIGSHDIYKHDGHQRVTIADDRATEHFFETLGDTVEAPAYVEHFIEKQEILFIYNRKDQIYASEALVYSYLYDAWTSLSIGDGEGGATGAFSHVTSGPQAATAPVTYANITGTYDDFNNTSYAQLFPNSRALELYGLAPDLGGVYMFNQSPDDADFMPPMVVERVDYDLDEVFGSSSPLKYWSRTIPLISGNGTVKFRFGGRNQLSASVEWGPEQTYVVGQDYKVDHRTTYRYPAIRLIQDDVTGSISMTGADLEIEAAHGR